MVYPAALTDLTTAKLSVLNIPHGGLGIGGSMILNEAVGIFERYLSQSTIFPKQFKHLVLLDPLV